MIKLDRLAQPWRVIKHCDKFGGEPGHLVHLWGVILQYHNCHYDQFGRPRAYSTVVFKHNPLQYFENISERVSVAIMSGPLMIFQVFCSSILCRRGGYSRLSQGLPVGWTKHQDMSAGRHLEQSSAHLYR